MESSEGRREEARRRRCWSSRALGTRKVSPEVVFARFWGCREEESGAYSRDAAASILEEAFVGEGRRRELASKESGIEREARWGRFDLLLPPFSTSFRRWSCSEGHVWSARNTEVAYIASQTSADPATSTFELSFGVERLSPSFLFPSSFQPSYHTSRHPSNPRIYQRDTDYLSRCLLRSLSVRLRPRIHPTHLHPRPSLLHLRLPLPLLPQSFHLPLPRSQVHQARSAPKVLARHLRYAAHG